MQIANIFCDMILVSLIDRLTLLTVFVRQKMLIDDVTGMHVFCFVIVFCHVSRYSGKTCIN